MHLKQIQGHKQQNTGERNRAFVFMCASACKTSTTASG